MKKMLLVLSLTVGLFASIQDIDKDLGRFISKNETLIDTFAEMQWQDNRDAKEIEKKWQDAVRYCENLTLDGKNDWRLPNKAELKYAYEIKNNFKNISSSYYWSFTTRPSYSYRLAWGINFDYEKMYAISKSYNEFVRCVRGKEFNSFNLLEKKVQINRDKAILKIVSPIYKEVKQKNNIESYEWFIKKYSHAPQVKDAIKNIHQLAYQKVKQKNNIESYEWFIKTYPKASQVQDAIKNIYKLLKKQNNIAGYEWFIKTYPQAPQVKDAISKIHQLAFDEAQDIDTISAYNTFIISYPMATEVKDANEFAKELERYKYTDTLPSWFRSIMPDFLADIFNSIFGVFSNDEKKSRALLIKAKQIERQGNEYYGDKKAGYVMITNRMYDLLQEEYNDTDATLRFLESEEFKDFVRIFKSVMRSMNDRLTDISRYSSEILEVSKQGFSEANTDRDMSAYYTKQHREWEKNMHLRDKGYK
jgi:hypothetical protein